MGHCSANGNGQGPAVEQPHFFASAVPACPVEGPGRALPELSGREPNRRGCGADAGRSAAISHLIQYRPNRIVDGERDCHARENTGLAMTEGASLRGAKGLA